MPRSRISAWKPRFVICVTATVSTECSSARIATIWSPSTTSPRSSTASMRSPSPSNAIPRSHPSLVTSCWSARRSVAPQPTLMFVPSGESPIATTVAPASSNARGAASSCSICSSASSESFRPRESKNLTPLYSGGLCEAEMTTPRSSASSATAGVGSTPATTAAPPAETTPRAKASSSSTPEARVSRPMKTFPAPIQSAAARPSRSTNSGVTSSPTTPRTPSVPKYRLATRGTLTLAELRGLAGLVEAGLLALDLAGVAGEEALPLERHAQLGVDLDERARDTVPDGSGLAARAAAVDADAEVVLAVEAGGLQRGHRERPVQQTREVLLDRAAVDPRLPVAGAEDDARDRCLALACAEVLGGRGHQALVSSGLGSCA